MPEDLLRRAGTASISDRLTLVMTRLRASGVPPRSDTETSMARSFWLPTPRTFSVTGSARISPLIPDDEIDRLVGRPGADDTGIVAYSLGRLPGDLRAGAIATLDGNSATAWSPGFGATHQAGQWLQYTLASPITFDQLNLQIVADGEHSVPTRMTVSTNSGTTTFTVPAIADSPVAGSVVDVPERFPALTGSSIRITFDRVRLEYTPNYYSESPIAMPLGIAEVGIPGLQAAPVPAAIPTTCRDNLVAVDGKPVWVSVTGTTATALDRQALTVSLCGPDAGGLALGPGTHTLTSVAGQASGFDIDLLALDSAPGGGAMPLADATTLAAPAVSSSPRAHVVSQSATSIHLTLDGVGTGPGADPFYLVLGQSINRGWKASVTGAGDLGTPVLIDGFANGWRIDPSSLGPAVQGGKLSVVLTWQPQRQVDVALIVSLAAIVACLVLALRPAGRRRRRRRRAAGRHSRQSGAESSDPPEPVAVPGSDGADGPERPTLALPFRSDGPPATVAVAAVGGVVTGAVAGAISSGLAGLAVGVATVVVLLVPRLRIILGVVAVAGIVVAGAYVALHQHADQVPPGGDWTMSFGTASGLAWAGVVFLGADAVVEVVLGAGGAKTGGQDGSGRDEGDDGGDGAGPGSHPADGYPGPVPEAQGAPGST